MAQMPGTRSGSGVSTPASGRRARSMLPERIGPPCQKQKSPAILAE